MVLCKSTPDSKRVRPVKTIDVRIDEPPHRPKHFFKGDKERIKFIKSVETMCRSSDEYRAYIRFLRDNMDWNRCAVLKNLVSDKSKKYSIEIHHEPMTLYSIVDTVLNKYESLGMDINPFAISDEVMSLHYEGKVGLIPLSTTQHQLVHDGRIFIPLSKIYQYGGFVKFCEEYEEFISEVYIDMIQYKIKMTQKCADIQSDVLNPEFVYVEIDGFNFPSIPKEWGERKKPQLQDYTAGEDAPQTFHVGDSFGPM